MNQDSIVKKPDTDWEIKAQKRQTNSERELEELNTKARLNFNKKQYEALSVKTIMEEKIEDNPTLF